MKYNGKEVTEEFLRKVREKAGTIFSDFDESDVQRILQAAEEVWQEEQTKKKGVRIGNIIVVEED